MSIQEILNEYDLSALDLVSNIREDETLLHAIDREHKLDTVSVTLSNGEVLLLDRDEVIEYVKQIETGSLEDISQFKLAKIIPLATINNDLRSFGYGEWSTLSDDIKQSLLYEYGIDNKVGWVEKDMQYRNEKKRIVTGKVIFGQERLDKEWCRSPRASHEAKVYIEYSA